jgi:hypothetical protein
MLLATQLLSCIFSSPHQEKLAARVVQQLLVE